MPIVLISHPDCRLHEIGGWHPESPARLDAIDDQLIASGLDGLLRHHVAPAATREQLSRVHGEGYIEQIFNTVPEHGVVHLDADTAMNAHSLDAAVHAAGAAVLGVDLLLAKEADAALCTVRPPGHHAERDRAMGFCIFNNVAVGAAHALEAHGLERVAIADFDVHHGNGTEDIFRDDPRVLFCSTFRHPFYPFTDPDTRAPNAVHAPLPVAANGAVFREAVMDHWLPALERFQPQLVLVSAGFDAHREDDMGGLSLTEADYGWVTRELRKVAQASAEGRLLSTLEGGYALSALGRSVVAHLNALMHVDSA